MEEIAKNAENHADKNAKLPILYGFIYYDQGKRIKKKKNYKNVLRLYDKVLYFGDHWMFYNARAKIYYYQLKKYDSALENINRSIELRPVIHENYIMRSRIYFSKKNYVNALADLRTAENAKPEDSNTQEWKEWASKNLLNKGHKLFKTDLWKAVNYYDLSIEFNNNNFKTYYWRGVAYNRLENDESALTDFKIAVALNPRHFESYSMIDYLLIKDRQWEKIISYWDTFLKLEPDHAEAYFERSGTHYHNRDFENALSDLRRACELGHKNACKRYNRIKK